MKFYVERPIIILRTFEIEAKSKYDAESQVRDGMGTAVGDSGPYYPERVRADLRGTLPVTFKIRAERVK